MRYFKDKLDDSKLLKAVLFLLSPFLAFVVSLKNLSSRSSYIVFIGICLLFGLNFTVTDERSADYNLDGSYYRALFERDYVSYGTDFAERLNDYLSFNNLISTDIYADFISYVVSRFSSNYHILFLVYAIVFTFFMAKSLKYLLKSDNFRNNSVVCLLLVLLFLHNDIFNINGVRFWTAAWVAVYSLFNFFLDKKKLYLLLVAITPLIHASYIFFVFITLIAVIFNNSAQGLRHLLIVSIALSPLMLMFLQSIDVSSLPAFMGRYFDLYATDEAVSGFSARRTSTIYYIISTIFSMAALLYINIMVLKLVKPAKDNAKLQPLFNFLVIFIIFCNLSTILPSVGSRFIVLSYPLVAFLWLNLKSIKQDSTWVLLFPVFFFMTLRAKVYLYFTVMDADFFYMNPISLIIKNL